MKVWRVYRGRYGGVGVVKPGFNCWAFFFPGVWGFAKGLHVAGTVGVLGALALVRLPAEQELVALPLLLVLMTVYGIKGTAWVTASLVHDGYQFAGTVIAVSRKDARLKAVELIAQAPVLPDAASGDASPAP